MMMVVSQVDRDCAAFKELKCYTMQSVACRCFERTMHEDSRVCCKAEEGNMTIVHFFSSAAHVWVPGAKTTGPIANKFGLS
jgi:hypothetical protein